MICGLMAVEGCEWVVVEGIAKLVPIEIYFHGHFAPV